MRSEEPGARASSGVGDSQHRGGAWWARTRVQGKEEGESWHPRPSKGLRIYHQPLSMRALSLVGLLTMG